MDWSGGSTGNLTSTGEPRPLLRVLRCRPVRKGVHMMNLIWSAVVGLVIGAVAKMLTPGKDPGGIIVTMAIGLAGSLIANLLGSTVGLYAAGQSAGFIMSVLGAMLLLWAYRKLKKA